MNIIRYLMQRLRTVGGKTILHVGAHEGQEAEKYQKWGAKKVIWIEADPEIYGQLVSNIEAVKTQPQSRYAQHFGHQPTEHLTLQALVGDETGREHTFYMFDNAGKSNSLFMKSDDPNHLWGHVNETGETKTLIMHTLDELLAKVGVQPSEIDIMVLDVQGAELLCLKGATQILKHIQYLETEISRRVVYEGGVMAKELDEWLRQRGFKRRTMLRRPHMNAIYKKAR